ncbi:MAG: CYTH domain-containing protein [Gammaproteobacteria bacterium]|nr:CYTH domain-containing protein [Gammaproteobacteria bacterium]
MPNIIEIERKFLLKENARLPEGEALVIRQGFLASNDKLVCRVRQKGETFYLSVKANLNGFTRHDFEYEIPERDGRIMLEQHCELAPVEKVRHFIRHDGMLWEVDVFTGANAGLVVAEIELESEDQAFSRPDWLGEEITHDPRYLNNNLYRHPYSTW